MSTDTSVGNLQLSRADLASSDPDLVTTEEGRTYNLPTAGDIGVEFYTQKIKHRNNLASGNVDFSLVPGLRKPLNSGKVNSFKQAAYDGYLLEQFRIRKDPFSTSNDYHPAAYLDGSRYRRAGSSFKTTDRGTTGTITSILSTDRVDNNSPANFGVDSAGAFQNKYADEIFHLRVNSVTRIRKPSDPATEVTVLKDEVAWMSKNNQEKLWNMIRFFTTRQPSSPAQGLLANKNEATKIINNSSASPAPTYASTMGISFVSSKLANMANAASRTKKRRPLSHNKQWYLQIENDEGEPSNKGPLQ